MSSREDLWLRIYGNLELPAVIMQHTSGFTLGEVASPTDTIASPTWAPNIPIVEPHHRVEVTYPSLNTLQWGERPLLHAPFNAAERYQPLPLINDSAVQRNTGRDLKDQSPFFSMCRASLERPAEGVTLCGDIFKDIRELSTFIGVTRLNVLIYNKVDAARPFIRICSGTTFRQEGGARSDGRRDYNLPLHEFLAVKNNNRWYQDIVHLIEMKDDRAARHVQTRLQEYVESRETDFVAELYEKFAASFKPRRQPYYDVYLYKDNLLAPKANSPGLFKSKKICMICKKPLNNNTHLGVSFPCDPEHVAGRSCVRDLCHASVPEDVKCLQCGTCLFNAKALNHLRFGVLDGKFENDPRFTEYENFEKSCADLDRELPSRNGSDPSFPLIVNPSLFMSIWYRMIFFGSQEMSLLHVEAINAPEFKIIEETIDKHIQRLDQTTTTIKTLDWWLGLAIFQAFDVPFRAAGLDRYINRNFPTSSREEEFFRPGFQRFCERALNRTLRFLEMRNCDCKEEKRLHKHGGRLYYNSGVYTNVWTKTRSENYFWQLTEEGKAYLEEFTARRHRSESLVLALLT